MSLSYRALRFAASLLVVVLALTSAARAEKIRVLVPSVYASELADLTDQYPDLELVPAANPGEVGSLVQTCQAAVGLWSSYAEALKGGIGTLRWIQSSSAGVEGFLRVPELAASDIVLTNAKIIQGPEIADHAMALLLNLTRDIKGFNERMSTGWSRQARLPLVELRGKTMLIIGLGGIGTQVAERAAAFGMRVIATDPKDVPYLNSVEYVGKPDELAALLPRADVVVVCAPRTPRTEGMLGPDQFALMRDGVYVINVSRGALIQTDALLQALSSGKVRAAGLDVTDPEPLPQDHPLWTMPNVTITPHVAGGSDQVQARRLELFRDNIARFVQGLPLRNVVDKGAGY